MVVGLKKLCTFALSNDIQMSDSQMVSIVQLVRTSDCGSEGRGFESHYSPPDLNVCCK